MIGSKIRQELFGAASPLGEILRLGDERFRVIGVMVSRGMSMGVDLDEMVHVPVSRAMKMFNKTSLFRVLVEVSSHEEISAARESVIDLMKQRHQGVEDVTVWTQDSVLATFSRILALLTAALAGIAGISLTVAGVGIMNVMLVSVAERTREIGLLKAVGVTGRQVVAAFLVEAAILSTAGGVAGLGAAFGADPPPPRDLPELSRPGAGLGRRRRDRRLAGRGTSLRRAPRAAGIPARPDRGPGAEVTRCRAGNSGDSRGTRWRPTRCVPA